jgi:hypothetical protein
LVLQEIEDEKDGLAIIAKESRGHGGSVKIAV